MVYEKVLTSTPTGPPVRTPARRVGIRFVAINDAGAIDCQHSNRSLWIDSW